MNDSERAELVEAIADELANRRQLAGYLLVDVQEARRQLHAVDDVLRRVNDAIVNQAGADNG
jgi:hypothetical protein